MRTQGMSPLDIAIDGLDVDFEQSFQFLRAEEFRQPPCFRDSKEFSAGRRPRSWVSHYRFTAGSLLLGFGWNKADKFRAKYGVAKAHGAISRNCRDRC